MANMQRIEELITFVNDHPEKHDQSIISVDGDCGTRACMAGWAFHFWGQEEGITNVRDFINNNGVNWVEVGAKLLDLEWSEATTLFHSLNTREMLGAMAKDLANGEPLKEPSEYARAIYDSDKTWYEVAHQEGFSV